jgi:malto-oligosyltrehalose trehalohydrolase/4-alpha-glucanotransferase
MPEFLLTKRWYPAKDAGPPEVVLDRLHHLTTENVAAAIAIWRVTPPGQPEIRLFVPLGIAPSGVVPEGDIISTLGQDLDSGGMQLVEAFSLDSFVRAFVALMLRAETTQAPLSRGVTSQLKAFQPAEPLTFRRSGAEQSNTSIRIGDGAILKVIRKLDGGPHPELEVGRFLSDVAGFASTPAMLAWLELDGTTLGILQRFVANEGDGWSWILDRLGAGLRDDADALTMATTWLCQLGRRTAEMHRAFGADTPDQAFSPEPVQPEDISAWSTAAEAMSRRALEGLRGAMPRLDRDAAALATEVLERQPAIAAALRDGVKDAKGFARTRHHGDYHLGQVLVTNGDAVIVDFEGEPLRPLEERRAKHAVLRDVAGMLRSVAYAAATAARALADNADRGAASLRLEDWEASASRSFLDAYWAAASEIQGVPAARGNAERLLHFFMVEKALYEVAYELANRPGWLAIPLRGVLGLLDQARPTQRVHAMPFGAEIERDGKVRFRLWAPSHAAVQIEIDDAAPQPMEALREGWHALVTDRARAGSQYRFVLPDGLKVPDPASRHQPADVHGPSEVIDPAAYDWSDGSWKGRPWEEAVVYELHIGAFTLEGSFRAAVEKLDHLVELGVTAIEIMPVAEFPGGRNWGYDGVLPYAPDASYGRPEELKALVDAAHARGLMVLLDVVYNHFGPEGAYQHVIAPEVFTNRHKTPWGTAINTDGEASGPVREYFIHNALYWSQEYHLDGLRLDAVHAILDDSGRHLLQELAERVRAAAPGRHVHLILENEENQASRLARAAGRAEQYTAQWNDDVHHVLHAAASGESKGYYADYLGNTEKLGRALAEGFAFQGEVMPYRGHARGEPSAGLPPAAFVAFIQNHDQVGNRAFGDRLTDFAPAEAVRAVAAVYLLLPQIPMIFMGEEWAAAQPFPFFCDFGAELANAVRNGRREEFARFPEFQDSAMRESIPDPMAEATFASAKLVWEDRDRAPHADWLDWYRRVIAARHAEIVPRLSGILTGGIHEVVGDGAVVVRWTAKGGEMLVLATNLSGKALAGFPVARGRLLWQEGAEGSPGELGPWSVRWSIEPGGSDSAAEEESSLDKLALRMGIEPEFRNAHGHMIRPSAEAKRGLLTAMGLDVADDAAACAALDSIELEEWLRTLPPVVVLGPEGPGAPVLLPASARALHWQLTLESGGERRGEADFASLELLESLQLDGRELQRRNLPLPADIPRGYHRLTLVPGGASTSLIATPGRCWLPPASERGERLWGVAAQLYLLRSASDWGIGDFGDLRRLVELSAEQGAALIGLNPLHAMFHDNPEHASPYSPASRLLLNILYIDIQAIPELLDCPDARALIASEDFDRRLQACRHSRLVAYSEVTALKLIVLEVLFSTCRDAASSARWQAFEAFRREQGEVLERSCRFLTLREHFSRQDPSLADWRSWPDGFRDPTSSTVLDFARQHRERVDFMAWMQWIADRQLADAAVTAADRGMPIGLYRDLAVGADRAGAETWSNAAAVISGAQVGAPPDIFNTAGQDWGLPPFNPHVLRAEGYRSFIELLRANMRHAGGLRIDHVMALQHLYLVPQGFKPDEGAYLKYPMDDMIGILALESHRHHCLVVGEDLGTVPEGFRERMAASNVLSYRVLFFERDGERGAFLPPGNYPSLALAVLGSHDLPTLRGWWEGRDIALREQLGLFPDEAAAQAQHEDRRRDRAQLLGALRDAGSLSMEEGEPDLPSLAVAVHVFLAQTPALLAMVQIDDLTDEVEPVNLPATDGEHPNWRRRLSMALDKLATAPHWMDVAPLLRKERSKSEDVRA